LEGLEDRVTPATVNLPIAVEGLAANAAGTELVGNLLFAGQETGEQVTITNATLERVLDDPATEEVEECSVLHLELAPINLALLGLHVDTSAICLDVTATEGGGLLGDLLCGLSGDLDLGDTLDLGGILGDIGDNLDDLLGQLDGLLSGVLGSALTVDQIFGGSGGGSGGAEDICTGDCEILDLSLGPVDLSLLGLNVSLDDCEGGPVQVCVSATASEGLLGGLLCGLADGPLGGGLGGLIGRIDDLIDRLGDLAGRLEDLDLPDLGKLEKRIDKLSDKLEKVLDRVDRLQNLDQLIHRVEQTVDQLDRLIDRLDVPGGRGR
jgi:hypothetical protein